ncbi:MAG: hypothetical protein U0V87_02410 [Acidobacteriota bacterium]
MPMSDEAWLASLRCGRGDTLAAVKRAGHAACDEGALVSVAGSMMRLRLPVELANDFSSCIEARRHVSASMRRAATGRSRSATKICRLGVLPDVSTASRRLPAGVGLLAILEEFCAAYDVAEKRSASRSEVFVRSRHRCEAPGCTARRSNGITGTIKLARRGVIITTTATRCARRIIGVGSMVAIFM